MKQLYTKWGREFNKEKVLLEYPRPSMKRLSYVNLNGTWKYEITGDSHRSVNEIDPKEEIIVPYSPESCLSGAGRQLKPDELLWYQRTVPVPADYVLGKRLLLHFGAVDQMCKIYVNRECVGRHVGGYLPFTIDLSDYVNQPDRSFELTVCVKDRSETSFHSRGKQLLRRGGMFYTAQSGIWQTVWMECVAGTYISEYRIDSDIVSGSVRIEALLSGNGAYTGRGSGAPGETGFSERINLNDISIELRDAAIDPIFEGEAEELKEDGAGSLERYKDRDFNDYDTNAEIEDLSCEHAGNRLVVSFSVPKRRLWSPESPYLYHFRLKIFEDEVLGYFAFRKYTVEKAENIKTEGGVIDKLNDELLNHPRIYLNHKPCFQNGVLDQGYYPEGLYTAPSDLAYLYDILKMRELGFNMLRKHLKIEPDRFYYHCDRIGMIVWQDMVNGGGVYKFWFVTYMATAFNVFRYRIFDNCYGLLSRKDKAGRREFEREMILTAEHLYNHPCIAAWVIFNEGWGQFDAKKMTMRLRLTDPYRLIDSASGWFDQSCGDFRSQHYYFMKLHVQWCFKRVTVISEYGGFPLRIDGHSATDKVYGYHYCRSLKELRARHKRLMEKVMEPEIKKGLSATVYTQLSDIEDEVNGILTYDREICKFDKDRTENVKGY
ncbi:MAG: glycoside hydrolase family 2 [Lachnospiraceae bacterium]|nr:glycoside hydrolase family 2 [Lachnospiraceae bacterium]